MIIDDYKAGYENSLPLLMTQKTRGGQEYYLPNEDLMRNAFKSADSVKQVANILGNDEQSANLMMKGTIDWLRSKGVVNDKGLVDPNKIRSVLDKNRNIVDALPQNIQAKLTNEVALADDYVKRLGELDQRMVQAQDNELDRLLSKAVRPEADPRMVMTDALKDPAIMRKLVDVVGKDPEMLSALRRSVYDIATEGAQGGGALKSFLDQNEKALKVLYGGTEHLDNLKLFADMQRRLLTDQLTGLSNRSAILRRIEDRVLQQRRRGVTTATFLAERLGVSDRTVYRDVRDLMTAGTPIDGEAGVGYRLRPGYDLPPLIDDRNSWFVFVLPIFERSSSIPSTGDRGVSTLRRTHTRFRSSLGMRSSSLRVPLFWMSIDGNTRRSVSFRSR